MAAQEWESAPLQPILRLIHCIQKERGASCALVGSLAQPNPNASSSGSSGNGNVNGDRDGDGSGDGNGGSNAVVNVDEEEEHPYKSNLRATRIATNSSISSFYRSAIWRHFCAKNEVERNNEKLEIATMLYEVRQRVDSGGLVRDDDENNDENQYFFFHVVIVEYNLFLSHVIQVFIVKVVSKRRTDIERKIDNTEEGCVLNKEARRNAKVALSLLDLILCFVTLKESLGMERATLSGLMADGINDNDEKSKHGARLNLIVNDLVMVVENQHQIMRDLRRQSGLNIRGTNDDDLRLSFGAKGGSSNTPEVNELLLDEHYCQLLRLVGDSVTQSDEMLSLQDHIRQDFDINGFQQAMTMGEFWAGITLYMDQLHSMELFLLEELENCEGGFEDLDLLSLENRQHSPSNSSHIEGSSAALLSLDGTSSQQCVVQTVSKMTHEELKDTLVSLLTQKEEGNAPQSLASMDRGRDKREKHTTRAFSPPRQKDDRPVLEEWEISLYEVEFHKRIGRGSAGTTYLGKYAKQDVAVKVAATSEMGLEGWKSELMSLKKMHHTNIIRFLGAIYNPSPLTYCLVLEYCHGGDLSVALAANNTPPKFFVVVTSGIASGLYYLHNKKYMHRDIKPSNVLLSGDVKSGQFTAKLTDFGLAVKMQNASVTNEELTAETGTYRYMAPEVVRHECYNYAADVYSFGLLMWEIITREKPFEPQSQIEAAGSVALEGKRPPFPSDIPPSIKTLIEMCWADVPTERMEVELIIKCLDDLSNDAKVAPWLAAPKGHPVYKQDIVQEKVQPAQPSTPTGGLKVQQKKKGSAMNLFRKKKK